MTDYELFERLSTKRGEIIARLDDTGAGIKAISDAAVNGEDVLAIASAQLDRQQLSNVVSGLEDARLRIAQRLADETAAERGIGTWNVQVAELPLTAAGLESLIKHKLLAAERGEAATTKRRDDLARYDSAMSEFQELRSRFLGEGAEPVVASEKAKAQMADPDGLFLPGSMGPLELSGRPIAEGKFAVGDVT